MPKSEKANSFLLTEPKTSFQGSLASTQNTESSGPSQPGLSFAGFSLSGLNLPGLAQSQMV